MFHGTKSPIKGVKDFPNIQLNLLSVAKLCDVLVL